MSWRRLQLAIERVKILRTALKIAWRAHMQKVRELERQSFGYEFLRDEIHTLDNCLEEECQICGVLHCPELEPLHFHHDGCPVCGLDEDMAEAAHD